MQISLIIILPLAFITGASPAEEEFFEKRIRPVLAEHCQKCHGETKQQGGLRLDTRAGFLKGAESGAIVIPGQLQQSKLFKALEHQGKIKMPPKGKLNASVLADFKEWVQRGAYFPEKSNPQPKTSLAAKDHWAFKPVSNPPLPKVKNPSGLKNPVDYFLQAKLEPHGLGLLPQADRYTLIRRARFVLTGLPGSYEEVQAFEKDENPLAYERLVDRLLDSPNFGERWARHWLDLARYADNRGYVGVDVDRNYPYAYTFRDWVINSFNKDLPYDRFLLYQVAADFPGSGSSKSDLAAMGFLTVGRRFINNQNDIIDDRIDALCRTTMGLTVTCARCHDHKYDPIPTRDYYSLYGVFASSQEPNELPGLGLEPGGPEGEAFKKELAKLEGELQKFANENAKLKNKEPRKHLEAIKPFENRIKQLKTNHPGSPAKGMVLTDRSTPVDPVVFLRGNQGNRGAKVPRQFLEVVAGSNRQPFKKGSGRLELAQAIVEKDNPLTARVWVNRVWGHVFGSPLVKTPSDFGLRSDPPSHPELLDHLAYQFMKEGWSTKKLLRTMLLSSAFRQTSQAPSQVAQFTQTDPENRLLSRMNLRRLDFETLHDSFLAVVGKLDPQVGGRSVEMFKAPYSKRRALYAFIDRQNLPGVLRTFDFALPDTHSPQRFETAVPQQALYLMNSPFVQHQALALSELLEEGDSLAEKTQKMFRLVLQRNPSPKEEESSLAFLRDGKTDGLALLAQALLVGNAFQFID
ncbi:MAG: DUF1553 domain-containing protein [Gemmataceae bacterium]|nr:DUF1553 domain-containing protein [Gemmataceae bacterium]